MTSKEQSSPAPSAPPASKAAEKEKGKKEEEELSEEDQRIKADLELLVERTGDSDPEVVASAIAALKKEIRTSTGSMTSVPKPLKFLKGKYETLKEIFNRTSGANKPALADVISWLGMTIGAETRDCLNYKLMGTAEAASDWGHEYVRHLCLEIGNEHAERVDQGNSNISDLLSLVDEIVPFLAHHNAEPEACDLLLELEQLPRILKHVDEQNYKRIALYLTSCADYLPTPEDTETLKVVLEIYRQMKLVPEAFRIALLLSDDAAISTIFKDSSNDDTLKRQLALMMGQHGYYNLLQDEEDDKIQELIGNTKRAEWFQTVLAKDLDIQAPIPPEEIYKDNVTGDKKKPSAAKTDSARQNLAATFVNAFVNAGYSKDKLMTSGEGDWLFKNRDHGRISAAASVGMICMWDPDIGANEVDKYTYTKDEFVKAGVMLGVGMTNVNVRTAFDVAFTFISEHTNDPSSLVKQTSALALGLAYGGSPHDGAREVLEAMYDEDASIELLAHVSLALGLIYVGTCDADLTELFVGTLMERGEQGLKTSYFRYLPLAIGLLYLGKQERADVALETLKTIPGDAGKYALATLKTCAYAGSGNVLKIQELLAICGEHTEDTDKDKEKAKEQGDGESEENKEKDNKEKETPTHQAVAVLGIALVAMKEDVGRQMAVRSMDHLLQYGDPSVRRAVPLALGLLNLCNPDITIMDTLSKFSHDHDAEVAMGAIVGLGLIGAGTNNSRVAQMLRGLAQYYAKEQNQLFMVRIAQGIVHMGKGTISLSPFHSDNALMRPAALAGLLVFMHTCLDIKGLILGKAHYLMYALSLAMSPRMLITLNEELEPQSTMVRVGTAVDVVGKAGNPKAITGFQTHHTPVLLGRSDRAELATDEFVSVTPILEGAVIIKPNPDAKKPAKK